MHAGAGSWLEGPVVCCVTDNDRHACSLPYYPCATMPRGVGQATVNKYGIEILQLVRQHSGNSRPLMLRQRQGGLTHSTQQGSLPHRTEQASSAPPDAAAAPAVAVSETDRLLYSELKKWRLVTARAGQMPAHRVFHNTVLEAIVLQKPNTPEALRAIEGIGEIKVTRYSAEVIDIVLSFSAAGQQGCGASATPTQAAACGPAPHASTSAPASAPAPTIVVDGAELSLRARMLAELKKWRRGQAAAEGKPQWWILKEVHLDEIVAKKPMTEQALRGCSGMGEVRGGYATCPFPHLALPP